MKLLTLMSGDSLKKEGKKLWWKLDEQLPVAYGVVEKDLPRIEAFKQILPKLKKWETKALKAWLKAEIYALEHNFCELSTAREEEWESRLIQIYKTHLEAIS